VSVRHRSLALAQEMKGQVLLSNVCDTTEVPDGAGTTTIPVIGSQSILIHDNPAFVDWSL